MQVVSDLARIERLKEGLDHDAKADNEQEKLVDGLCGQSVLNGTAFFANTVLNGRFVLVKSCCPLLSSGFI